MEQLHSIWTQLSGSPVLRWVVIFAVLNFLTNNVAFFRARKVQPGKFRWNQAATEAVLITVAGAFGVFSVTGFTALLHHRGLDRVDKSPTHWWVVALEFGVYFVLFDTWFYWWHRLMHIEPVYTLVHRWHHLSLTPTVVSTVNVNPIESLINGGFMLLFVMGALLAGIPIHQASMPFIGGSTILIGLWIHCGYEFLPRWWNKSWATKWFITATFHDQHHQYFRYNYGGFTTVWDRICGTIRPKYERDFANPRSRILEEKRRQEKQVERASESQSSETVSA